MSTTFFSKKKNNQSDKERKGSRLDALDSGKTAPIPREKSRTDQEKEVSWQARLVSLSFNCFQPCVTDSQGRCGDRWKGLHEHREERVGKRETKCYALWWWHEGRQSRTLISEGIGEENQLRAKKTKMVQLQRSPGRSGPHLNCFNRTNTHTHARKHHCFRAVHIHYFVYFRIS